MSILLGFPLSLQAQQDSIVTKLSSFVQNINTFNQLYPQEKVYLHFDNTGYFLNENIWFKAYIVVAENHQTTILSRVLYVELISPDGYILETKKLKIENGQCHGDFYLKPEQFAGFYEVRAYTRVMLNYGDETIFSRVFPVFEAPKKEEEYDKMSMPKTAWSKRLPPQREKKESLKKLNLDFFPEGGNLVQGIASRMAFKATNNQGLGVNVEGSIYNDRKEVVATFSSMHNGMGNLGFIPETGKYTAIVHYENKDYSFPLPDALNAGYIMGINNLHSEFIGVQLQKSENLPSQTVGLSIACRGKVYIFETIDFSLTAEKLLQIPRQSLPSGVNQATLFTKEGEILAERLFFVNHHDNANIVATQQKAAYSPFEKINIGFEVMDKNANPIESTFSVSVTDAATTQVQGAGNMLTNLLLSSDLKGHIESIDYYFESDDNRHKMALDLLMMTQGWRRYSWKQMAGIDPFELKHHIEKGIVIDGQVLSIVKKKEKENLEIKMWMYSEDGFSQQGTCTTDEEGKFNFLPDDFYGTWKLSLQAKEEGKRKHNRILLDRQFTPDSKTYSFFDTHITLKDNPLPDNSEITTAVEIMTTNDSLDLAERFPDTHLLPQVDIKGKQVRRFPAITYNIEEELDKMDDKGVDYNDDIFNFLWNTNKYFGYNGKGQPTYKGKLVGFEGKNIIALENLFLSDLKTIEVVERPCIDASGNFYEVTVLLTYTGRKWADPKGIRLTTLEGYSNVKEFYSPDYSTGILPDEKDFRRTLYWNPNVKTDSTGKANVSFYNNSSCKQINISAEGISDNGIPIIYSNSIKE